MSSQPWERTSRFWDIKVVFIRLCPDSFHSTFPCLSDELYWVFIVTHRFGTTHTFVIFKSWLMNITRKMLPRYLLSPVFSSRTLKHPTGALMLRDVGGVDFLTQLSSNVDPQLRAIADAILDQLFHLHIYPPNTSSDQQLSSSFHPGKLLIHGTACDIMLIYSMAYKNVLQEHHPNKEDRRHLSFTMPV